MPENKIEIKIFDMRNQRPLKVYDAFIELREDHFFYKAEFSAMENIEENDPSMGEEKVMNSFERKILKRYCTGVDINYLQKTQANKNKDSMWKVTIYCFAADDTHLYFESKEQAFTVFNKIFDWLKSV